MSQNKLFMIMLGCKPKGRHTEQHDIFFTIGKSLKDAVPHIKNFWPEGGTIHIDAWREVTCIDGFKISIKKRNTKTEKQKEKLFFLNLGGYKRGEFEEFHYKMIMAAANKSEVIQNAKTSAFYLHTGFKGASSHIDDKYGIDVDDLHEIEDILPAEQKKIFEIHITQTSKANEDDFHIGYTNLLKIK
jgi:hypothetical protein